MEHCTVHSQDREEKRPRSGTKSVQKSFTINKREQFSN